MEKENISILAYYHFTQIEDPQLEVARHHQFLGERNAKGRIYISTNGINGQMSAEASDAQAYIAWLHSDPRFKEVEFKIDPHHEHAFPRLTVKVRKQLVALDQNVDFSLRGERVSPKKWKKMLEEKDEKTLLLDVRNDYEWKVGRFKGADLPPLEMFRQFPSFAEKLKKTHCPKETKVMMYCTGGIRCELYSALLKKEGFEKVYQLEGGVIKYGQQEGSKHWEGKLFVFDDRLAVPLAEGEPAEVISHCHHCPSSSDIYYNCANMDCNALFLSCPSCAEKFQGCCSSSCQAAPRVRPFEKTERPKPFRRIAKSGVCN